MNTNSDAAKFAVFLGAGASSFAGYRTFSTSPKLMLDKKIRAKEGLSPLDHESINLLKEIEEALLIKGRPTTQDNFLLELKDYTRLWRTLKTNNVLKSRFLSGTRQWGQFAHFANLVEKALNHIIATTLHHYSVNRVQLAKNSDPSLYECMRKVFNFYTKLAYENKSANSCMKVFTTNYDMLLEDLFSEFNSSSIVLINGFPNNVSKGTLWKPEKYQESFSDKIAIHYYRLHGCVCWRNRESDSPKICFQRGNYDKYPLSRYWIPFPGREFHFGQNPNALGFREFFETLQYCQSIIFIGFSFRDEHINNLVLSSLAVRESAFKLIAISSSLNYTDILERLKFSSQDNPYPMALPNKKDIICIDTQFGVDDDGLDEFLMTTIKKHM